MNLEQIGQQAKQASVTMSQLSHSQKNEILAQIADELISEQSKILQANAHDLEAAQRNGMDEAMLDRLALNAQRLQSIASDVRQVTQLDDPVGRELDSRVLANGMRLSRRRVPLGVVGVIYEARPNVTIDIAALCLKTGNAAILRGGKETLQTNLVLVDVITQALTKAGAPEDAVQYIADPARERVAEFLKMDQYVDMLIPRGGQGLHQMCKQHSTIPVIIGGFGISHMFIEATAQQDKALEVIVNAKTDRPSTCNTLDTLLVDEAIAQEFLPRLAKRMVQEQVTLVAETVAFDYLRTEANGYCRKAQANDFDTEWLSLVLGVKVVAGIDEALSHMREHNASHSDAILTERLTQAERFMNEVDSAAVYVNASTRFTDGGQFGLGAEVAVSTQKLHARGPMGLDTLTSYKWIGIGDYLTRD